jgi:hypothetical protein
MHRLLPLLAALLASGLIAAGCGDDDDDNGDDSPVATESAPVETTPTDTTDTSSEDADSGAEDVDSGDQAVEACKRSAEATAGQFSEDLTSDLEEICDRAASGDVQDAREASVEICKRIVEEALPESAARDEGLEICEGTQP